MRGHISSNLAVLDALHEEFAWIPGKDQIRPSATVMATKAVPDAAEIRRAVFGDDHRSAPRVRLVDARFPYCTEGQHLVCWFTGQSEWSDAEVDEHVAREAAARGIVEYVWYENPKKSVVDDGLFHVHVFCPNQIDADPTSL